MLNIQSAKSNRRTCKQCKKKINKGAMIFATYCSGPYHLECVQKAEIVISSEALSSASLKRDIAKIVEDAFDFEAQPLRKKSRKRKFRVSNQMKRIVLSKDFSKLKKLDKVELLALCHYNDVNIFTTQRDKWVISGQDMSIRGLLWSLGKGVPKRCADCGAQMEICQYYSGQDYWVCGGKFEGSILKTHGRPGVDSDDERYFSETEEYTSWPSRTRKGKEVVESMRWPSKFEMECPAKEIRPKTQSALLALTFEGTELFSEANVHDIMAFLPPTPPHFFEIATRQLENAGRAL